MNTAIAPQSNIRNAPSSRVIDTPLVVTRRRLDRTLVAAGAVFAIVLAVAAGLLTWGHNFANDYVQRELSSQQIFFPKADALTAEGRTDLLGYAGRQVTSGQDAQAYAGYIDHHLSGIADGKTFAQLGGPERAAKAAVTDAVKAGKPATEITKLQATADGLTAQRDTIFKGETLRGLLLSTYAWWKIGSIAWIAAIVAFAAAGLMVLLVAMGVVHLRRHHPAM